MYYDMFNHNVQSNTLAVTVLYDPSMRQSLNCYTAMQCRSMRGRLQYNGTTSFPHLTHTPQCYRVLGPKKPSVSGLFSLCRKNLVILGSFLTLAVSLVDRRGRFWDLLLPRGPLLDRVPLPLLAGRVFQRCKDKRKDVNASNPFCRGDLYREGSRRTSS